MVPNPFDDEYCSSNKAPPCSAARALPLLLLPNATGLRAVVDGGDEAGAYSRVSAAAGGIARSLPNEVRVHLARGLDRVWDAPCTGDASCHHRMALQLAVETMRDCAFGPWNPDTGRLQVIVLADPVDQALADIADKEIHFSRLDAAIRALAPAASADICVSGRAGELLAALLAAHRRSLLAYDEDMDDRGTHALIAARALLTIAADGDDTPVYEHIDAYADSPALLMNLLRRSQQLPRNQPTGQPTAARIWPSIVARVIDLHQTGHTPFRDRHHGDYALAALMPSTAGEVAYLYRELAGRSDRLWQPLSWQTTVERWLPLAQGDPTCVDHLIGFLRPLLPEDQARAGLPWVTSLVLASPGRVANRTFLLSTWLIEIRKPASDTGLLSDWQRIVDALVRRRGPARAVLGVTTLASIQEMITVWHGPSGLALRGSMCLGAVRLAWPSAASSATRDSDVSDNWVGVQHSQARAFP